MNDDDDDDDDAASKDSSDSCPSSISKLACLSSLQFSDPKHKTNKQKAYVSESSHKQADQCQLVALTQKLLKDDSQYRTLRHLQPIAYKLSSSISHTQKERENKHDSLRCLHAIVLFWFCIFPTSLHTCNTLYMVATHRLTVVETRDEAGDRTGWL